MITDKGTLFGRVHLREVVKGDLAVFFDHQLDLDANRMAAFTAKDPSDRQAFDDHWGKILADRKIVIRTILYEGQIAGYVLSHTWFGKPEVSYWIGKPFWGKGIATQALAEFLRLNETRPLYAYVAVDNAPSLRVLEKCGFSRIGEDKGYSNARGREVGEYILELR